MRDGLTALAGLVILAMVAALAGPGFVDWGQWRSEIDRRLGAAVGMPIVSHGPVTLQLLPPGGILATASCSARVSADEFTAAIKEAANKTGVQLQQLEERRQAPDHPMPLAFPEGRYLKFFVYRRMED